MTCFVDLTPYGHSHDSTDKALNVGRLGTGHEFLDTRDDGEG